MPAMSTAKKAHSDSRASISDYADLVAQTTQMNRSSAFISISVVKSLLEGSVYKRALSIKALRRYFSAIYTDFGKAGLVKAIYATREHIKYRESCGLPFGSVVALCNEFEKKI